MDQDPGLPSKSHTSVYASFFLNKTEFVLNVKYVQEVVNAPAQYTNVPLAPVFFKGLLNLRGAIIPIVDLRSLFHIDRSSHIENQKIAIVEQDGIYMGILFDDTGEVFREQEDEKCDFNDLQSNQLVSGAFKRENGKRILQILNIPQIVNFKNIPRNQMNKNRRREDSEKKRGERRQCISFEVGASTCALPISDIQEILMIRDLNKSVLNNGTCIGTIDLRGTTVPVIDFPALLRYREPDHSNESTHGNRRIIVMKMGEESFGLLVDSIDSIISFFEDDLVPFPVLSEDKIEMIKGCISLSVREDILLLDYQKIFSHEEINEITQGHSHLYKTESSKVEDDKKKSSSRKTYITFKVAQSYALPIIDVKEIINMPEKLLNPPGLDSYVRGVLNLRGQLVTIVDTRKMYSAHPLESQGYHEKVIIFKHQEMQFGLIVDSVESIVTFAEKDMVKLPRVLSQTQMNVFSTDISDVVDITDLNGHKTNVMILSLESVAGRILKKVS